MDNYPPPPKKPTEPVKPITQAARDLPDGEDMRIALHPRNADGSIQAVIEDGQTYFYPAPKRDAQGLIRPIWYEKDFEDGQLPDYIERVPAIQDPDAPLFNMNYDPSVLHFRDPVRNLSTEQAALLLKAEANSKMLQPAPEVQPFLAAQHVPVVQPLPEDMIPSCFPEDKVFAHNRRLWLNNGKRMVPITNFYVEPLGLQVEIEEGRENREYLMVCVTCGPSQRTVTIPMAKLDDALKIIMEAFPSCHAEANAARAGAYISNMLRDCLCYLETIFIIESTGFIKFLGKWVYAHDGARPPAPNVEFRTGHTIPCFTASRSEALYQAAEFLKLSERLTLVLPLFLLIHLSILFALFKEAGHPVHFPTFLKGVTASFKTTVASCCCRFFADSELSPESSFADTMTSLEVKLAKAAGRIFLLDDFRPPLSATAGKDMQEKLEFVIRLYGDGIAKGRSNAKLEEAKKFYPAGACLITGEDLSGSRSSLLRCLILDIAQGDISSQQLKIIQDHPEFLWSHLFHFVEWCGHHGNELVQYISSNFQVERQYFATFLREPRQIDIAGTLMITANVFFWYAKEVSGMETSELATQWADVICEAVKASEENSRERDPVVMYLAAIISVIDTRQLVIAANQNSFDPAQHVGFWKNGCWWLLPDQIHQQVLRFWDQRRVIFPSSDKVVRQLLYKAGVIEVNREMRNGHERILYLQKSTLVDLGRPRMLVLRVDAARRYLEEHDEI